MIFIEVTTRSFPTSPISVSVRKIHLCQVSSARPGMCWKRSERYWRFDFMHCEAKAKAKATCAPFVVVSVMLVVCPAMPVITGVPVPVPVPGPAATEYEIMMFLSVARRACIKC